MTLFEKASAGVLCAVFGASLFCGWIAPYPYDLQIRDMTNAAPSARFWLGADELGRDRFSRLLYGSRISLLLAPAAALIAVGAAALIGGVGGLLGGVWDRLAMAAADLFLSLPWLFLLLMVRAALPLNTPPVASVLVTFALLGSLGWAGAARVIRVRARTLATADFAIQARACGTSRWRLLMVHVLPNLKAVMAAQFWISIPLFVLAEANLGLLGLGVSEPLPSWGNLLRDLENFHRVRDQPWLLAPAALLILVVGCFQLLYDRGEVSS
ncbi:MAG: ABC transporter permease [Acidobacteria bacterium]|nr:ABC transporter permease [Acidobacteriota bacterium]